MRCKGKSGFLSSRSRGIGPHLKVRWDTSRVVARNSGFLSSGHGCLREPLELHKGSQAPFRVLRGNSGLLSRCYSVKGLNLVLMGEFLSFFFFFNWSGKLRVPVRLQWGSQGTSHVASGKSALFSSCKCHLGISLK